MKSAFWGENLQGSPSQRRLNLYRQWLYLAQLYFGQLRLNLERHAAAINVGSRCLIFGRLNFVYLISIFLYKLFGTSASDNVSVCTTILPSPRPASVSAAC